MYVLGTYEESQKIGIEKREELNLLDVFMSVFGVKNKEICDQIIREAESVDIFKRKLKTYIFNLAFN